MSEEVQHGTVRSSLPRPQYVDAFRHLEQCLDKVFAAKARHMLQDPFDRLIPYNAKNNIARKVLSELDRRSLLPEDLSGVKSIVELSNAVEQLLKHYSLETLAEQQIVAIQRIEEAFESCIEHMCILERRLITDNVRLIQEQPLESSSEVALVVLREQTEKLQQHNEDAQKQISHLRNERDRLNAAHKEALGKLAKEAAALRQHSSQAKKEAESSTLESVEKERSLQIVLAQLSSVQDELSALKRTQAALGRSQSYRPSSSERHMGQEVQGLRAAKDALRHELYKAKRSQNVESSAMQADLGSQQRKILALQYEISTLLTQVGFERDSKEELMEKLERISKDLQKKEGLLSKARALCDEHEQDVARLRSKAANIQKDSQREVDGYSRRLAEAERANKELADAMNVLRVGITQLQHDMVVQSEQGSSALEKVALDHSRVTQRLETLVAHNEKLMNSSSQQDRLLRNSGDLISTLTKKLYGGGSSDFDGDVSAGAGPLDGLNSSMSSSYYAAFSPTRSGRAERELVESRAQKIDSEQLRLLNEKWQSRLTAETDDLRLELREVMEEKELLQAQFAEETGDISNHISQMEQRLSRLTEENATLRSGAPPLPRGSPPPAQNRSPPSPSPTKQRLSKELGIWRSQVLSLKSQLEDALSRLYKIEEGRGGAQRTIGFGDSAEGSVDEEEGACDTAHRDRLMQAEARVAFLTAQIQSMPPSLQVANAEKRVLQRKLESQAEAYSANMRSAEYRLEQMCKELHAAMAIEVAEKETLQQRLREQAVTIHQLTNHLKALQRALEEARAAGGSRSYTAKELNVAPAPWETDVLAVNNFANVTVNIGSKTLSPSKPLCFSPVRNRTADSDESFDEGVTGPRWGMVTGKVAGMETPNPMQNTSSGNLSNSSLVFDRGAPALGLSLKENEIKFNEFNKMLAGININ